MKVEVFLNGNSMGAVDFSNWRDFENYMLRWLTLPIQLTIKFEGLQEQICWYAEFMDLIKCAQLTQQQNFLPCLGVTVIRFDEEAETFFLEVA